MPDKRPKHDQHNPSQKSLQRWDNEGGATKRSRAKRPRDFSRAAEPVVDIATGQVEGRPRTPEEQGKDPAAVKPGQLGGAKGGRATRQRFQSRNANSLPRRPLKLVGKLRRIVSSG
jgi:hypothetical protein